MLLWLLVILVLIALFGGVFVSKFLFILLLLALIVWAVSAAGDGV